MLWWTAGSRAERGRACGRAEEPWGWGGTEASDVSGGFRGIMEKRAGTCVRRGAGRRERVVMAEKESRGGGAGLCGKKYCE